MKLSKVLLWIVLMAVTAELASSYILFRHFAGRRVVFRPEGIAVIETGRMLFLKLTGRQESLLVTVDHGPLFGPDDRLGYRLNPGRYTVTEKVRHAVHQFRLTVDDAGRRATSNGKVAAAHRIYVLGDSSMFGWGLNDEETLPWLLQSNVTGFQVVNLTLTSYSTVHALLQLQAVVPAAAEGDIVILPYHQQTNDFNVFGPDVLQGLRIGYERKLGDTAQMDQIRVPFGMIDEAGSLSIGRFRPFCVTGADCDHPSATAAQAARVSALAFQRIAALGRASLVVTWLGGPDDDPVIVQLRSKGIFIADLRIPPSGPDADDVIPTDTHHGAFWQYDVFIRLLAFLKENHLLN